MPVTNTDFPPHSLSWLDSTMGLLDETTTLLTDKITRQHSIAWDGGSIHGYEIHHGRTEPGALAEQWFTDGLGWRQGNVVRVYAHGLLDNGAYRQWFFEQLGWQGRAEDWSVAIDAAIHQVVVVVTESGWAEQLERSMDRRGTGGRMPPGVAASRRPPPSRLTPAPRVRCVVTA